MYNNNADKKIERKFTILGHIVHEYVSTAVPVSSKSVAEKMGGTVSSATVRNIMVELEEEGYIRQPHTSAGRVPTDKGYRFYVNRIQEHIGAEKVQDQEGALSSEYDEKVRTIKEVIEKTSYLISRELHNAGIVMWPSTESYYLKQMDLVRVKPCTILAVLVTMTNAVQNYIITLNVDLVRSDLDIISNYINNTYEGHALFEIAEALRQKFSDTGQSRVSGLGMARAALEIIESIVKENIENEIYWEGLRYFLDQTEGQDINITRRIIQMFSDRDMLINILRRELPDRHIRVYIGGENEWDVMSECSVITSGYSLRGRTVGRIGVVGPTRMNYARALNVVSSLSDLISRKLEEING